MPGNVPTALTSFVGRGADVARVAELLGGGRLLTLTGAGGCGKTRLGRETAQRVGSRFPGGVWWVELASVTDGARAADALVRILDLPLEGRPAEDVVIEYLADVPALVVLDNCEHVVDALGRFVDRLLRGAGAVTVLATSREPLGVEGETTWRVPSMTVPPAGTDLAGLLGTDASRLFLERVGRVRPDVAPGDEESGAVAQICDRLDGIPLALELAAARAGSMTLQHIVAGLDDRFRLLTGGPRHGLARQRTLLASVQWSYDLLVENEQVLLRRLSVFVGGFTAAAAESVAGFSRLSAGGVTDLLTRLVDRSLVQFDVVRGRYRLLETIREYGGGRLGEAGEAGTVANRHLAWACDFAEGHDQAMTMADLEALDVVEDELPNLRVALDHAAASTSSGEAGLRLVAALTFFWAQRGLGLEGAHRAARVLEAHPGASPVLRGRAWAAKGYDDFYGMDFESATDDADHGLAEARSAGDLKGQARNRHVHGAVAFVLDPPAGRTAMTEAITLAQACDDLWCETDALQILAFSHLIQHRPGPAQEPMLRSAAMAEEQGNTFQLACHHTGLAMTAAAEGRLAEAAAEARLGAEEAQRIGDPVIELWGRAGETTTALTRRRFADVTGIAAGLAPPGKPISPITEAFVSALRRIAETDADPAEALDALDQGAELLRTTFVPNEGLRLALIGIAGRLAHGDAGRADDAAKATLAHATAFGSALTGPCRVLLARVERRRGELAVADQLVHDGLAEIHDSGLVVDLPDALETLAGTSTDLGGPPAGVRLLGAARALREHLSCPGAFPTDAEADQAQLRRHLGDEAFAALWEEGRRMDASAAVAYARRSRGERKRPASGWPALTPTELDVARLTAEGLTNPEIGTRLFISRGTVKTHLEHIYAKLGINNRAELAATVVRRQR